MTRLSSIIVPVVFLLNGLTAQIIIPEWFEKLPDSPSGFCYSVGYSGKYQNQSLARQVATSRALSNMAKQHSVRLIFEIEEFADGRFRLLNPSFELSYDESVLLDITANYTPIDSSITNEGYYILIACPSIEWRPQFPSNDKTWEKQPKWTKALPNSRHYIYGIGIVSNYSSWIRAWKDADEYARFDLGKNIEIEAESIHAVQRDDRFTIESKILRLSCDIVLKQSFIVERWYDQKNDIYYSLCCKERRDNPH
ncbi:MAG TPA: hypothetical protein DHW42_02090 [Candidatus Marinimicrobia bacterium]|nr:hypothetical protein [Candidatus Neomarinimicrobiota bacterium]